ncbi:retinoblastoma-binding protein 5-like [Hibiscus syriacus]|uniref:Retinoblastoma-binding protein 5-like n=1 Tax=Hibiscus syriacus TaxID=106335 RepID=A0A6A3CL18_HIBSY|nr:zinc finger protein ZAT9-like [Hibiscus syriacus]KAE8729843.1 retinoblastoma-binding protein 5-like [Hibiscus syriacus]
MDKHKCTLCFKSFANGRALGGHMRSHMFNLSLPPKVADHEFESASASYSSSEEEAEEEGEEKGQSYGLRENPKRSVRLVDPVFVHAGSVVLQDRESETESSMNPTRRRSKQTRRILGEEEKRKKVKVNNKGNQPSRTESWAEPESVSSISDTTTEDIAFCLMMLSRDKWKSKVVHQDVDDEEEEETYESQKYFKTSKVNRTSRGKYRCETCSKVFKSYQALGGHRASRKKTKPYSSATHEQGFEPENVGTGSSMTDKKIHECPVCFRVFSSGQGLGGHKRSHVINGQVATSVKISRKLRDSFIDLNLPAPTDEDEASQIELSAVSDAEFVNRIK